MENGINVYFENDKLNNKTSSEGEVKHRTQRKKSFRSKDSSMSGSNSRSSIEINGNKSSSVSTDDNHQDDDDLVKKIKNSSGVNTVRKTVKKGKNALHGFFWFDSSGKQSMNKGKEKEKKKERKSLLYIFKQLVDWWLPDIIFPGQMFPPQMGID